MACWLKDVHNGSIPLASSVAVATAKRPQSFTPVCFGPTPAVITMLAPKTFHGRFGVS